MSASRVYELKDIATKHGKNNVNYHRRMVYGAEAAPVEALPELGPSWQRCYGITPQKRQFLGRNGAFREGVSPNLLINGKGKENDVPSPNIFIGVLLSNSRRQANRRSTGLLFIDR